MNATVAIASKQAGSCPKVFTESINPVHQRKIAELTSKLFGWRVIVDLMNRQ
jgi:hypothetical protein